MAGEAQRLLTEALGRARAGDLRGADDLIERALALSPRDPAVLLGRAVLHRAAGRLREALLACDAALRLAQDYVEGWLERGVILSSGGSIGPAREAFAKVAALAPEHAETHANLAELAAREGDWDAAENAARRALELAPGNIQAAAALGKMLLERREHEAARALLEPLVGDAAPGPARMQAMAHLGRALEAAGDVDAAFAWLERANGDFLQLAKQAGADRAASHREFVEAIAAGFSRADKWSAPPDPAPRPNHIFLLGFPRSGTTLVETVLASLAGVAALEERPTLVDVDRRFLLGSPEEITDRVAGFAALPDSELAGLREAYWAKVQDAGIAPDARHFVDMDPLKGSRLPFIARLFPQARTVVMRRDPRDVVLSCFRTQFALTGAAVEFASLERTARLYDAMMRLIEAARDRTQLAFHELRYEDLVADFEPTTRALCDFAGIAWSSAVGDFAATSRDRRVATASAAQVRKGLYDGSRQWERYAAQLEPVLPVLNPWIERFGYA